VFGGTVSVPLQTPVAAFSERFDWSPLIDGDTLIVTGTIAVLKQLSPLMLIVPPGATVVGESVTLCARAGPPSST
jgi:hypothetical protein